MVSETEGLPLIWVISHYPRVQKTKKTKKKNIYIYITKDEINKIIEDNIYRYIE